MRIAVPALLVLCAAIALVSTHVQAGWDDGYWSLKFDSGTSTTAPPLRVGVDLADGNGFSFQIIPDHDGDGVVQLPLVPVGGRLALDIEHPGGGVGCEDLWDLTSTDVVGGTTIQKPLLIVAEDIEGESLGVDYGEFTEPPFERTSGERYTVVDGRVAEWSEPRFVNNSGVPGLEEFVQTIDSLPNFNGDVIVSTERLIGTFIVPEPESILLAMLGIALVRLRKR